MSLPLSIEVAEWVSRVDFDSLPEDVIEATKLRVLDTVGLAFAGARTEFGQANHAASVVMAPVGPCHVFGIF